MKRIIMCLLTIALLSSAAFSLDEGVEKKAAEYKGYDELIDSITEIEYMNRTYYMVAYTKTLSPSGYLLIGPEGVVEDYETMKLFFIADTIHKNYPPESVGQWVQFSDYFAQMSGVFSRSDPNVSRDSGKISEALKYSAAYLNGSIEYLSPEYAEKYLAYDREAIALMEDVYERTSESRLNSMSEYRESLNNIRQILSGNVQGIESGGAYMAGLMGERLESERNTPVISYLIAAAVGVLFFLFFVVKRGNGKMSQ